MATYVLVHGAWGGSYGWRLVRPLLQKAGHTVFTPSLTGQGERSHLATPEVNLSTHIQDVSNAIWYEDLSDIILVGHSYGGMVVTGVADRMPERIKHLVYLDAFLPADGQSLFDLGGGRSGQQSDDWRVPPLPSSEPIDAWRAARRVYHPRATLAEKIHLSQPIESRPFSLTYIVATGRPDPSPFFDNCAERLRSNPRWTVREISGGHGMIGTNPDGLVRLFEELFPSDAHGSNGVVSRPSTFAAERESILSAADVLVRSGVLSHSNHGNSSVRLGDDRMLITGASSLYGQTPETLAVLDLEGNVQEGRLQSTSAEIVRMHAIVYKLRPDVGAVIHTHSPMVSTYAMAHQPMPIHYEGLLRMGVHMPVPVAPWGPRGSRESVMYIENAIRENPGCSAVLLANHGLLAWAKDQMSAARLIISLEEAAEMMLRAAHLGGSKDLPAGALDQVRQHMAQFAH